MKVLFIGGTGVISSACSSLALERGVELYLLNRGQSMRHAPQGAQMIQADVNDRTALRDALKGMQFDVVVNWIAYVPEQVERDVELFRGQVGQYIFISTASAYQKPPASLPVTKSTPLHNSFWEYSRHKIDCERRLMAAYHQDGFPVTIVRPSHTYDKTKLPIRGGYTAIERMRRGKPVVVHGDGTSIWTLTHHRDFAKGFVGLLGHPAAIGEGYHITSDEWLTWNQINQYIAQAAGCEAQLVHIPSDFIARFDAEWGASLLGDKSHSAIFDNTKIKRLVPDYVCTIPFARGAEEMVDWYDSHPARQVVDPAFDALVDRILASYELAGEPDM